MSANHIFFTHTYEGGNIPDSNNKNIYAHNVYDDDKSHNLNFNWLQ